MATLTVFTNFVDSFLKDFTSDGVFRVDQNISKYSDNVDDSDLGEIHSGMILLDEETGRDTFKLAKVIMEAFSTEMHDKTGYDVHPVIDTQDESDTVYYDCFVNTVSNTYKFTCDFTVSYPYLIFRIIV